MNHIILQQSHQHARATAEIIEDPICTFTVHRYETEEHCGEDLVVHLAVRKALVVDGLALSLSLGYCLSARNAVLIIELGDEFSEAVW